MKKTTKMLGAVAISAAMAIGTAAPAFADDPVAGVNPGSEEAQKFVVQTDGTAQNATTVDVWYKAQQINASVPLNATIVASGTFQKADAIMAPAKDVYKITNNSETTKIKVTNVASANDSNKDWGLAKITDGTPAATVGQLDLTLTGYSNGTTAGTVVDLSDATAGALKSGGVTTDWTADEQGSIYLDIAGRSLPTAAQSNAGSTEKKTEAAFKVTYTLSL